MLPPTAGFMHMQWTPRMLHPQARGSDTADVTESGIKTAEQTCRAFGEQLELSRLLAKMPVLVPVASQGPPARDSELTAPYR